MSQAVSRLNKALTRRRWLAGLILAAGAFACLPAPSIAQTPGTVQKGPSGLPLPRFVSLKSNEVNVRAGPGTDYAVKWTFKRTGWPVEVVQECLREHRVGRLFSSLPSLTELAGLMRRTALVAAALLLLATNGGIWWAHAVGVENFSYEVLTDVKSCDRSWCEVSGTNWRGYISQKTLFGVYPNETFD